MPLSTPLTDRPLSSCEGYPRGAQQDSSTDTGTKRHLACRAATRGGVIWATIH